MRERDSFFSGSADDAAGVAAATAAVRAEAALDAVVGASEAVSEPEKKNLPGRRPKAPTWKETTPLGDEVVTGFGSATVGFVASFLLDRLTATFSG